MYTLPELTSEVNNYKEEIRLYNECMHEIIERMNFIKDLNESKIELLITPRNYFIEIICLQFRMILELIILSSLVANKKKYRLVHRTFSETISASKLIENLKSINRDFYPVQFEIQSLKEDDNDFLLVKQSPKSDFPLKEWGKLYASACSYVHAKSPLSKLDNYEKVKSHLLVSFNKIEKLLKAHYIKLTEKDRGFILGVGFGESDYGVSTPIYCKGNVNSLQVKIPVHGI